MNLRDISLKKAYSSDFDNILHDFYIPALKSSIEYDRLAGFFSSTSLAIAAKGILGLIENEGVMKLVVSPKLNKEDLEIIVDSYKYPEKYIEIKMLEELEKFEEESIRDHVSILGWMIANKRLEIKVAVAYNNERKPLSYDEIHQSGLFHQKVGILKDSDGNLITFSGSLNETATSWIGNIEEFKVFRNWDSSEEDYVKADIIKFKNFWNNRSPRVRLLDIPLAVKKKLIEIAPKNIDKINLQKWYKKIKRKKIVLYQYQKDAIDAWFKNDMRGIFDMATGTGKTFTALGCLDRVFKTIKKIVVVINCPKNHLVQQWKREINKFGIEYDDLIIADRTNPNWKDILSDTLIDISLGYKNKIIVLTTHATFSSNDFINIIQKNRNEFNNFLISDEVHRIGAKKRKEGLIKGYDPRLGLSATPKRWFDDIGTAKIYNYFNDVVFEFGLKKAITTINPITGETYLTPYRYLPKFISLSIEELEEYIEKTRVIAMKFKKTKDDIEKDEYLKNLLFKRADIIKNAKEKYSALEEIFKEIPSPIKLTLIYCIPQQIDNVMSIINKLGFLAHRFTMEEETKPNKKYNGLSERDFILQMFAEEKYQFLVAMKCLDLGVDIPPARTAILLASSGNPGEYIQRIGRVLRRYKNKKEAILYDIIVIPSFKSLPPQLVEIEWSIFEKEMKRYEEIAKIAINNAEALELIYIIKNRLLEEKNE